MLSQMKVLFISVIIIFSIQEAAVTKANKLHTTTTTNDYESQRASNYNIEPEDLLGGGDGEEENYKQQEPHDEGEKGEHGAKAPTVGGVVYTRWGRTVCPDTYGTEIVYVGMVASSTFTHTGGGANYLCVTRYPTYRTTYISAHSHLYGSGYFGSAFNSLNDHTNVPCAVCYTLARSSKLMIPGDISCPPHWTIEYVGYLMTENDGSQRNTVYECVDETAEIPPNNGSVNLGARFTHVDAVCGDALPCPPYLFGKPITCVLCTR